jgi:hypothetical protein
MRSARVLLLIPMMAAAQMPQPAAFVRGVLLERDSGPGGQFSVRTENNQVLRYQFDRKTYVEREKLMIDVPRLSPGDKVEVVSDVVAGSALRYARTIHVMQDTPPPRPASAGRLRPYRPEDDRSLPKGNLTYSGVVARLTGERLLIRTRDSQVTLSIRKDTRYLEDGAIVEAAVLKPNTRVFIRAGRDLYGQLEAYQVVWGNILNPR